MLGRIYLYQDYESTTLAVVKASLNPVPDPQKDLKVRSPRPIGKLHNYKDCYNESI